MREIKHLELYEINIVINVSYTKQTSTKICYEHWTLNFILSMLKYNLRILKSWSGSLVQQFTWIDLFIKTTYFKRFKRNSYLKLESYRNIITGTTFTNLNSWKNSLVLLFRKKFIFGEIFSCFFISASDNLPHKYQFSKEFRNANSENFWFANFCHCLV